MQQPALAPFSPSYATLAAMIRGDVVLPDSPSYDEARGVWNVAYQGSPAAIVRVADAKDVATAIRFARSNELEIAVRSGGHSLAGHSTGDGVLVIDLRGLAGLHIDPATRTVVPGAGLTAGAVTTALVPHGLAIPFGDTASVGIAGLTLGGGIGYLARKTGLAIDRVRAMEVVTAEGEVLHASASENADLFWALRGGGGNFGVVTRFTYEAVPVGETLSGALVMPLDADILAGVLHLADAAPDDLTTITEIMPAPPAPFIPEALVGTPVMFVLMVWVGDPAEGAPVIDGFRALAAPIADLVMPMPYGGIYEFSAEAENPAPAVTRTMFADHLDADTLRDVVDRLRSPERPEVAITQIRVLGGEMGRVAAEESAFAHRSARIMFSAYTILVDPDRANEHIAWTDGYMGSLVGLSTGAYVNFLDREGDRRVRDAYPPATYARLAEIKRQYDPDNVFHRNQNVAPAEG